MPAHRAEVDFVALDALLQFRVTLSFCSDYLNVSPDTIQRRIKEKFGMNFGEYHNLKMQRTAVKLQQKAIEEALKGNTVMMIFALKNMAGWSDKQEVNQTVQEIKISSDDERV